MSKALLTIEHYKCLSFYDLPTIFQCRTQNRKIYLFCLLEEETLTYLGKQVGSEQLKQFLNCEVDLLTIFQESTHPYLKMQFSNETTLEGDELDPLEVASEMLPAAGLYISASPK
ncbi:MAG TPA: hypothetical protein PKY82_31305 [Pyrinomonadaceae bacterium]|nr:hypothetical protein [Pyrinomonadaceae bacterium]